MTGSVIVTNSKGEKTIYGETFGTAHYITVNLYGGNYTLEPVGEYGRGYDLITEKSYEVIVESELPNLGAFEYPLFREGITQEQVEELLELFYGKPMEFWTLLDKANWNYALR